MSAFLLKNAATKWNEKKRQKHKSTTMNSLLTISDRGNKLSICEKQDARLILVEADDEWKTHTKWMNEWMNIKNKELRGERKKSKLERQSIFLLHFAYSQRTHVHSNSRTVRRNETDNRAMTVVRSFPFSFLQFRFLCLSVSPFLCHTLIFHSICARLCRPRTLSLTHTCAHKRHFIQI